MQSPPDAAKVLPPSSPVKPRVSTREIWSLTWPQMLMMLLQFLIGFTDITIAGHISSQVQASVGFITQCLFFLLVVGIALANGGIAAISQSLGAGLPKRAARYIGLLFKISATLCLCIVVLAYTFRVHLMVLLQVPPEIRELTISLWTLFLPFIPGQYFVSLCAAIFRAQKKVHFPLICIGVICAVNALAGFYLALGWFGGPALGARGIIFANLLAVWSGVAVFITLLIKQNILRRECFAPMRWAIRALPFLLKVALPAGGLQVLWQLGFVMLFVIMATLPQGAVYGLAGLTAGLRIESLLFLPTMAFGATASILVGHCLGAGDRAEAKRVALRVTGTGATFMSLMAVCMAFFVPQICAFVAPDPAVNAVAAQYLYINLWAAPCTAVSMIVSGIMTGAGATIYTFVIFSVATWCIRLPLAWFLGHHFIGDATGIFFAMLVSQALQAASAAYVVTRCDWFRFAFTAKRFSRG